MVFYFVVRFCAVLFKEHEEDRHDQAEERYEVVPLEGLPLEQKRHYYSEYCKGDHFLDHFQLHEVEWTAVPVKTNAVCRNLCAIFKESDSP